VTWFDEAAEETAANDDDTGWLLRLSLTQQMGLLLALLTALNALSVFDTDLAGEHVPPAVRSGVGAPFALVGALLAAINKRNTPPDGDDI
jgi:hypothetical protein